MRRQLAVLPLNDSTSWIVTPMAYPKSESQRRGTLSSVSTGPWEYCTILQCQQHQEKENQQLKKDLKVIL